MKVLAVLVLAAAFVSLDMVEGQFGAPPKPRLPASKGDLPAIKCGVCAALVEHLYEKLSEMREAAPFGKVHEDDISVVIDGACEPVKASGRWMTQYDIVESNGYLELQKPGGMSHCYQECETIAKSCSALVEEELDVEELIVALWRNKLGAEELRKVTCEEWSERCVGKRVTAPKDREDFPFEERTEKDMEIADMMQQLGGSMESVGGNPGMRMYSPDDMDSLEAMMQGMEDPYGYDGDGGFGEF